MKLLLISSITLLLLPLFSNATELENLFFEKANGTYNFQDSVCQNSFDEGTEDYNTFKLKIDGHGYKMTKNQLSIEDGTAVHETVIKSGVFGTCIVRGSGEISPLSVNESNSSLSGFAYFNINIPKKFNKKTNLGCKCSPLPAMCRMMIPYVKQELHKVSYEIRENDSEKSIRFIQEIEYDDADKTIESESNFKSKYRKLCSKHRNSDAPPTNIFTAID